MDQLTIKTDNDAEVEAYPHDDGSMILRVDMMDFDGNYAIAGLTKAQAVELGQYLLTWSKQP